MTRAQSSHYYTPQARLIRTMISGVCGALLLNTYAVADNTNTDTDLDLFGDDISLGDDFEFEESGEQNSLNTGKTLFGGNRKFIFQQDFGYIFSDPEEVASNRSSLRFQWNWIFNNALYFNIDLKPIAYYAGDNFLQSENKNIDAELVTKELFMQLSFFDTSITVGNKIVIWGESESSAVTDIISPQNIEDLVFTSLDESRLSQAMLIIEQYLGQDHISLLIILDRKVDRDPIGFSSEDSIPRSARALEERRAEVGFRWKRSAVGLGDFSIMLADVTDNTSVEKYTLDNQDQISSVQSFHGNYKMLGLAANIGYKNTTLKLESAYNIDRPQTPIQTPQVIASFEEGFGRIDELVSYFSIDYQQNGYRDWSFSYLHTRFLDDISQLDIEYKNTNELYGSITNRFWHELITASADYQYALETNESIGSASIEYQASDNLKVNFSTFFIRNLGGNQGLNQDSFILRLIYNF